LQDIRNSVANISNEQVKTTLAALIDDAEGDLKKARENVERWYDDAMDRVSGWYKKKTQLFILVWALAVTLSVNADTVLIANTLAHDATLRASLVAMAEVTAKEALPENATQAMERIKQMSTETEKLGLPIGWSRKPNDTKSLPTDVGGWALKIIGLSLTAIAVSLGAPFWFDVLNKLINIRSAGKKPERSHQEKDPASK
jgi:hypothetical protein